MAISMMRATEADMTKRIFAACVGLLVAGAAIAAGPGAYSLRADSDNPNAPALTIYRGSSRQVLVPYYSGTNLTAVTGYTPFFVWSTNSNPASVVTSSYSVASIAASNEVTFTFPGASFNYAPGTYWYCVGLTAGSGEKTIYRTGSLILRGAYVSPSLGSASFTTNW